ncbi:MAG: hypothetical protein ABIH42_09670 [Planctomycetota bacterium]
MPGNLNITCKCGHLVHYSSEDIGTTVKCIWCGAQVEIKGDGTTQATGGILPEKEGVISDTVPCPFCSEPIFPNVSRCPNCSEFVRNISTGTIIGQEKKKAECFVSRPEEKPTSQLQVSIIIAVFLAATLAIYLGFPPSLRTDAKWRLRLNEGSGSDHYFKYNFTAGKTYKRDIESQTGFYDVPQEIGDSVENSAILTLAQKINFVDPEGNANSEFEFKFKRAKVNNRLVVPFELNTYNKADISAVINNRGIPVKKTIKAKNIPKELTRKEDWLSQFIIPVPLKPMKKGEAIPIYEVMPAEHLLAYLPPDLPRTLYPIVNGVYEFKDMVFHNGKECAKFLLEYDFNLRQDGQDIWSGRIIRMEVDGSFKIDFYFSFIKGEFVEAIVEGTFTQSFSRGEEKIEIPGKAKYKITSSQ